MQLYSMLSGSSSLFIGKRLVCNSIEGVIVTLPLNDNGLANKVVSRILG